MALIGANLKQINAFKAQGHPLMSLESPTTPVDAHVHLYRLETVSETLDSAAVHFGRLRVGAADGIRGCLLLGETADCRVFDQLRSAGQVGNWRISECYDEEHSLLAERSGVTLSIISGRQMRTSENLEVLAIGTLRDYPDRMSLAETVEAVHDSGALAVLPWGFGKWTGERLSLLNQLLDWVQASALFLGDNGGRLGIIDAPPLLASAACRGFRVLPGSDPLPLPGERRRVGSFGFLAELELSRRDPWRVLRDWITARSTSPIPYGSPLGAGRFLVNQLGIQVYQRLRRGVA